MPFGRENIGSFRFLGSEPTNLLLGKTLWCKDKLCLKLACRLLSPSVPNPPRAEDRACYNHKYEKSISSYCRSDIWLSHSGRWKILNPF